MQHTPGPWFMSGVRFKMERSYWHAVNRYNAKDKLDDNIACVGYNPRTGEGFANARLIAVAPEALQCANMLDDLCAWLLHRFGPDSPEGREATFRQKAARAVIAKATGK